MRVALVSCVKTKRDIPQPAKDLYTSPLFKGLRRYAEAHADTWFILSAEYGLVAPDQVLEPYEKTLNRMSARERARWAEDVKAKLARVLPAGAEVIVLAGERYRADLVPFLKQRGHKVSIPLEGMPFGRQLQFLSEVAPASSSVEGGKPSPGAEIPEGPFRLELPEKPNRSLSATRSSFSGNPGLSDLTSRAAVLDAIAEFDRTGRDAFLERYRFGPARRYFLEFEGKHYDSKAIVGASYGYQYPDRGPLENTEFSGGHQTVQRKLEDLGFTVSVLDPENAVDGAQCPFCSSDPDRVFYRGRLVFALWDAFPVTDGHALLVPNRHVGRWMDATQEEREELFQAIPLVMGKIREGRAPDGFNIGINDGAAAGQTVDHLHLHVIPRYAGDVADPRGGIRWVIPERAPYWEDE